MNFEKAIEYVKFIGNEVELVRLRYLLTSEPPPQKIIAELFAGKRPDGG
jgi:hypothetical protein